MKQFPVKINPIIIFGAACWALSIVFFLGQVIVQMAWTKPYSLATNYISDLGNTVCGPDVCSPLHSLMNATFFLVGALHILGAIATYSAWPRRLLTAPGLCLIALAGAGLCVVGLSPENAGGIAHASGAVIGLLSVNLAMIVLGLALVGVRRWLGITALIAGSAGLVGFVIFIAASTQAASIGVSAPLANYPGVTERLADYPGVAMIVVFGAFLLASAISHTKPISEFAG